MWRHFDPKLSALVVAICVALPSIALPSIALPSITLPSIALADGKQRPSLTACCPKTEPTTFEAYSSPSLLLSDV